MTDAAITEILKNKGIYVTTTRVKVYRIMLEQRVPVNAAQIHKISAPQLDRVSVYRALQVFVQKGIISTLPRSKGWPLYLLKKSNLPNDPVKPGDINIYFTCSSCGRLTTQKAYALNTQLVPANYIVNRCQVILEGICTSCQESGDRELS
ncbi:MAG: hypothetical protein JNM14_13675 [Ferruginibacter sp.]|nr:hypothetical protein [Ferruginibacter sp.]